MRKLVTFCPISFSDKIREAIFLAGGGDIGNYKECSFSVQGIGTFKALEGSNPFVGNKNERHTEAEERIEVIYKLENEVEIIRKLKENHPYEEVAFFIQHLENTNYDIGSGLIGELETEMSSIDFLTLLKEKMNAKMVRHTKLLPNKIKRIAVCGGSGSFLLNNAIASGADVFVSADFKYHEFFDAENRILIADIGHYETEQFTYEWIAEKIKKKFPTFAHRSTNVNTNPVHYF